MKAIDRFCYKHPRLGIPDLMKYIVLANAAVFALDLFSNNFFTYLLMFHQILILSCCYFIVSSFIFYY